MHFNKSSFSVSRYVATYGTPTHDHELVSIPSPDLTPIGVYTNGNLPAPPSWLNSTNVCGDKSDLYM